MFQTTRIDFLFIQKLTTQKKKEDFIDIEIELRDRYGQIPKETKCFIDLAKLGLLYQDSLVNNIDVGEESLVFKIPSKSTVGGDQLIPKIISYKNNNLVDKKFKKAVDSVLVIFLTKKGYPWYDLLIDCNNLFL